LRQLFVNACSKQSSISPIAKMLKCRFNQAISAMYAHSQIRPSLIVHPSKSEPEINFSRCGLTFFTITVIYI
jgi:hypothetical protein